GQEPPHYGSVLSYLHGPRPSGLPPFVVLPGPIASTGVSVGHGQSAGYLGPDHEPFFPRAAATPALAISDGDTSDGVDLARLQNRETLLDAVDAAQRRFDALATSGTVPGSSGQAFGLLFAERAKRAFDIGDEREGVRSRYGMNTFG